MIRLYYYLMALVMGKKLNLTGKLFGRLLVISEAPREEKYRWVLWRCKCECGNEHIVKTQALMNGSTRSCGCLFLDTARAKGRAKRTHGATNTRTYNKWVAMKGRCSNENNQKFKNYGGRGIKVCERWANSFSNFLADMGEAPEGMSLDRIDPNGDYTPENCRWATQKTQQNNRTNNVILQVDGKRMTLSEAARHVGITPDMLQQRLKRGDPLDYALRPKGRK